MQYNIRCMSMQFAMPHSQSTFPGAAWHLHFLDNPETAKNKTCMNIKKNQTYQIEIDQAAYEGKGIGFLDGKAVFVKNAAPGDVVKAKIHKLKKNYCEATLEEVITPSSLRVEPRCRHAAVCGGCSWQHLAYSEQLKIKTEHVREHLRRIGGFADIEVSPCIEADNIFYYRNKMEYSFGSRIWLPEKARKSDQTTCQPYCPGGMHPPGFFNFILNLEECHLQVPLSWQILNWLREYAEKHRIPPYDSRKKEGYLRNLIVRNGIRTEDIMVNIVTFVDQPDLFQSLAESLHKRFPQITTLVNNINDTPFPVAAGRCEKVCHGNGYITEKLGCLNFRIESNTFFQPNPEQAEKLYEKTLEFTELNPRDKIVDLYCGTGALTLFLAAKGASATGIEINRRSVRKAKENAALNQVSNCRFISGDIKDVLPGSDSAPLDRPDVLVADPPRAGIHPQVTEAIKQMGPRRFVYISCNSATLARDLNLLSEAYRPVAVQPIDMFPHTYHIETAVKLERIQ